MNNYKQKICFVVTTSFALNVFLIDHLNELSKYFNISVCSNFENYQKSSKLSSEIRIINIPISRKISIFYDLYILFLLTRIFLIERFDAVHSITPKAGLLAMTSAFMCNIPIRTHTFTGQVWANKNIYYQYIFRIFDKLIAYAATDLIADSHSQARFLEQTSICKAGAITVFGSGSISGVDINRFSLNVSVRNELRNKLKINESDIVFLYLGRINKDKGVLILIEAFSKIIKTHNNLKLVFVGPDEDRLTQSTLGKCPQNVYFIGHTSHPEKFLSMADILCIPSYREGFGNVVIEAASIGIPAIGTRIYGLSDAIVDQVTGLLSEPGNSYEYAELMLRLSLDKEERERLGTQAKARAIKYFDSRIITAHWLEFYIKKLGATKYE